MTLLLSQSLPAQEVEETTKGEGLITRSLERDIATAGGDELAAWCLVLGLDTDGGEDAIRGRLRAYYGLQNVSSGAEVSGRGTRIVIESASRSEYLQVELSAEEVESVVRLSGGVVVTIEEPDRGRSHRVEADTVIFNQSRRTISAIGDIRYTVDTDGREESFTGDSLTFEVTDWTGVIFRGTSKRQQDVDGVNIDFFFRGESIKRAGKDILVLENGEITSHDTENPDYALKARKIWITGPGEWGLFSATLYVGHIPVFYLPFYWKSGSDLLFNPVIGTKTRAGYYIQTTSYLIGRKESDDGYSIMGFGDTASGSYDIERDGLFLIRVPSVEDSPDEANTLKFMLDGYTGLGVMTGFMGSFPDLGSNASIDFYATAGVSRSVDDSGSPYFNDGVNSRVFWNSSYIGAYEIPFRWGTQFDVSIDRWSFYIDWYSDPYYFQDFADRKENFDWLSFLLSEEETDTTDTNLISQMKWEIKGSESYSPSATAPWLQTISLDSFRTSLTWLNDDNNDITQDNTDPDYLDQNIYDPARKYYYPDQLIMPDMKLSLRGSSPTWSVDRIVKPDELPEEPKTGESGEGFDEEPIADSPEAAGYIESFDAIYNAGLFDASLNYGIQSQLYIEDFSDSELWETPSDIDFEFDAARINTTQRGDLSYGIDFWDGLTGVNGTTNISGFYQTHADIFGSDSDITDETQLEDYNYSQFLWDNSFSYYIKPFQGIQSLSGSSVNYSFDGNIYAYQFENNATADSPDYGGSWISGKDEIRKHEAALKGAWTGGPFSVTSTVSGNIPPLDYLYTISVGAGFDSSGWRAGVSQQNNYADNAWSIQPIIMNASWTGWKDEVTLSQNARYDPDDGRWTSTESTFRFWGFETRFVANYGASYHWNISGSVWDEGSDSFSPSTLKFSFNRDINPRFFWKNRLQFRTILDTSWNINLRQPTDNVLNFKWTQELKIFKFLDLQIAYSASNASMYLYFEGWRDELGIPEDYNFFTDLFNSFNFFDTEERRDSQFNMERIDLSIIHHLRNWDLTLEYGGWPALNSAGTNYRWKSEFSMYIKWNPLPMFNQRTNLEDDQWTVDSFE